MVADPLTRLINRPVVGDADVGDLQQPLTEAAFESLLRDVWGLAAKPTPTQVLASAKTFWTIRFWSRLTRWRRLLYWLFPDWHERDLWDYLRAHGVTSR